MKQPVFKKPVVKEPVLTTPSPATAPAAVEPPPDLPIWVSIPYLLPRDTRTTVWQKPIGGADAPDLSPHLRILLDGIASVATQGGKVVLVTSVENGVGRSSVARSLNMAALNGGMLSVLIQAEPEAGLTSVAKVSGQAAASRRASLRSVDVLLSRKAGQAAGDDIRGEFDLIVIDTPSLAAHPEAAALSAHADLVILVTRDSADNAAAIRGARASLAKFGGAEVGIIVNQVSPGMVPAQPQREMGLAS
jgi:Mrp family chromosome partitioning ATPase